MGTGEERERAEVQDLTGQECIEQNPELWKQFNQICDDEEKVVEQAEQADDVPELIDSDDESDDEDDHDEHDERVVEHVRQPDRRVTRSMTQNEVFLSLLAMISVAELLRAKKKKAQEIKGTEVETPEFDEARQKELQSFIDTEMYIEVDDDGQEAISTRWVYTYKPLPDGGFKPKARLVARGYEAREISQLDTSSLTCTKANFRLASGSVLHLWVGATWHRH